MSKEEKPKAPKEIKEKRTDKAIYEEPKGRPNIQRVKEMVDFYQKFKPKSEESK